MEEAVVNENTNSLKMETYLEKHTNILTIFPRAPCSFSDEPEIVSNLFNKFSIDFLHHENCSGFVICQSDQPNATSENSISRQSSWFIPAPHFSQIVLIKRIHRFGESLEAVIGSHISSQLSQLNLTFKNEKVDKIPIVILFIFIVQHPNKELENCNAILDQITKFVSIQEFEKLDILFRFLFKNKSSHPGLDSKKERQKLKNLISVQKENLEIKKSIFEFLQVHDSEVNLQISTKKFKKIGSAEITLADFDEVVYLYKLYFPAKDHSLETLPSKMWETDSLLYKTGHRGELLESSEGYFGEMKDFWENYVTKLSNPVGLLIKSYSNAHVNAILHRPVFSNQLDIDWIYCGHKMILAIEIGRTNLPESPIYSICNKLEQVLGKILPSTFLALHAIFRSFPKNIRKKENEEYSKTFWLFVRRSFRFVIFFPNLSAKSFKEVIQASREPLDKKARQKTIGYRKIFSLISTAKQYRLSSILFLMHEDLHSTAKPKTFYVDKDLNISESRIQVTEIFQAKVNYRNPKPKYKLLEFVSGIFALSTLIKKEIFPSSADKTNTPRDQKNLQDQKVFLKQKNLVFNEFLDVVLSPQQHRILSENKRRVLIAGEPGSGKTSLLLAKAQIAAYDSKIDHILFAIPEEKTQFKDFLLDFVNKRGNERLKSKFILATFEEMSNPSLRRPNWPSLKQLHRSILLMDEIYMTSVSSFSKLDQNLMLQAYLLVLPHVQQLFSTNVVAGQMEKRRGLTQFVLPHGCIFEPLNILFRSSHHISAFSTGFIHTTKPVTRTSARVSGCFTSPQTEIIAHYFSKRDDPIFSNSTLMNPCFESDRRAIIFSDDKTFWTEKFSNERKDVSNVLVVPPIIDFYEAPFTGCEAFSVIVIVDDMLEAKHDNKMFIILNLAITRAQYEVMIIVRDIFKKRVEKFIRRPSRLDRLLMDAANQLPVDITFLRTVKWSRNMINFVQKLTRIAIQRADERLLGSILEKVPAIRIPIDTILGALDEPKPAKFLDYVDRRIGAQVRSRVMWSLSLQRAAPRVYKSVGLFNVTEPVEIALVAGFLSLLTWFLDLVGKNAARLIAKLSGKLLFSAYYNGTVEVITWTLSFLSQFEDLQLIEKEVGGTFRFLTDDKVSLLVMIASQNYTSATCAQILFDHGFPDTLLLHELFGKNALHYAIWLENIDIIHVLLQSEKRRRIFLSALYDGMTADNFARSLHFDEIAKVLMDYYESLNGSFQDDDGEQQYTETIRLIFE